MKTAQSQSTGHEFRPAGQTRDRSWVIKLFRNHDN